MINDLLHIILKLNIYIYYIRMNLFSFFFLFKNIKSISQRTTNNLLFLDIDNTLLVPQNIFIYYEKDGIKERLTPEEYAVRNITKENKKYYDYKDFNDKESIRKSIETSIPLYDNLEIIDEFVKYDWELGILTARGQERLIARVTPKWIDGKLKNKYPEIKRDNIYAINDKCKKYEGVTDPEKKLLVLKKYVESNDYDRIAFIDDNSFTIDLIKKYNESLKKDKKIILILAKY